MTREQPLVRVLKNQVPAILWAIVIFGLSSIPGSSMPLIPFGISDKVAHGSVFFVLCFLVYRALRWQDYAPGISSRSLVISLLLTAAYGASDEIHQLFVPGRDADVYDVLADVTGGLLCIVMLYLLRLRKRKIAN